MQRWTAKRPRNLKGCRRLAIVGNGGIATELAHEVSGCEVVWLIRQDSISTPFLDPDAAKFLLSSRQSKANNKKAGCPPTKAPQSTIKKLRYALGKGGDILELHPCDKNYEGVEHIHGAALGPDWAMGRELSGSLSSSDSKEANKGELLKIFYNVEVEKVWKQEDKNYLTNNRKFIEGTVNKNIDDWGVYLELRDSSVLGCDMVVSATGVIANVKNFISDDNTIKQIGIEEGGGIIVDECMRTSVEDVYAIGDAAWLNITNQSKHWFQMRLWTQARHMGFQAAKCMFAKSFQKPDPLLDISFDLFTHVTTFFGFKIVLLGCYNGQNMNLLSPDCYLLMRITPGVEYIKCVMQDGRMQGALLIGETDMEETFENLILDQLYIKDTENNLLDPEIDIDDYYD